MFDLTPTSLTTAAATTEASVAAPARGPVANPHAYLAVEQPSPGASAPASWAREPHQSALVRERIVHHERYAQAAGNR